eukprot:359936-Chlamydomonas_euryale.AAC.9
MNQSLAKRARTREDALGLVFRQGAGERARLGSRILVARGAGNAAPRAAPAHVGRQCQRARARTIRHTKILSNGVNVHAGRRGRAVNPFHTLLPTRKRTGWLLDKHAVRTTTTAKPASAGQRIRCTNISTCRGCVDGRSETMLWLLALVAARVPQLVQSELDVGFARGRGIVHARTPPLTPPRRSCSDTPHGP